MDISQILKVVCPWIASAVGGPFGGMAVEAAANALGIGTKTTDAIKQAISGATPEQMLALKNADQAFAESMQKLGFDHVEKLQEMADSNVKDARNMENTTRSNVPALLALVIVVGFFGILIGMMAKVLSVTDNQALLILLGALSAAFGAVMNFYFGSTSESGRKTEIIAQSTPPKQPPVK